MKSGINQYTKSSPVPDSAHPSEKGKARDIVAQNVGLRSGHEVDRAITTVNKIDELEKYPLIFQVARHFHVLYCYSLYNSI